MEVITRINKHGLTETGNTNTAGQGGGKEKCEMFALLKQLAREESGQDLIDYALLALMIALGVIAGMGTLAGSINAEFVTIGSQLT